MKSASKNILLTGVPGIGKTTLVKKLFARLAPQGPVGFYTEEIRNEGRREGFKLVSPDGRTALLSHIRIHGPYRVGKYGVDVHGFEAFMDRIPFHGPDSSLVIIDEIGRMECFSEQFKKMILQMLDAPEILVATIALKNEGIIADIKKRSDIRLVELTRSNRETLREDIVNQILPGNAHRPGSVNRMD